MKKTLYMLAVLLTAMLGSCASETVMEEQLQQKQGDVIRLRATVEGATRALAGEDFGVGKNPKEFTLYAWETGKTWDQGKFIDGVKVVYNETTKEYEFADGKLRYWPHDNTKKITFFAYRGETGTDCGFNKNTANPGLINYQNTRSALLQKDLLVAKVTIDKSGNKIVNLNFKHALSKVKIKFKTNNPKLRLMFMELYICGIYHNGNLSFSSDEESTLIWDNLENRNNANIFIKDEDTNDGIGMMWSSTDGAKEYTSDMDEDGNNLECLFIPQHQNKLNPADSQGYGYNNQMDAYLHLWEFLANSTPYTQYIATPSDIYIPLEVDWEPGKVYTYIITMGDGENEFDEDGNIINFDNISVQVTTSNFDDEPDINI